MFRRWPIKRHHLNLPQDDPWCHGNGIWDKIGYNSACIRDIRRCLHLTGVFGDGLLNDAKQILPRPTSVAMATPPLPCQRNLRKIGYNSADIREAFLCITGNFRGRVIEWYQTNSTATNPRCHGNEIWDKIGYKTVCIDISRRPLRRAGGFRGRAIQWCQSNFNRIDPGCHGNEIWDTIVYNSACIRDISEIFASNRGLSRSDYWMMSHKFYHDRPWLPWQRNLRQNRQ